MRTVDLARRVGCSVGQVRKLEAAGVLPPVARPASGYRVYGEQHETSLRAYGALTVAVGPVEARLIMVEVHRDRPALLARLDSVRARLHQERHELDLAREAVTAIGAEPSRACATPMRQRSTWSTASTASSAGRTRSCRPLPCWR